MTKAERKLCDNLLHSRKLIGEIFDNYLLENISKGDASNASFERNFRGRLEYVIEERLNFIKNDLALLQTELEVSANDSSKDTTKK